MFRRTSVDVAIEIARRRRYFQNGRPDRFVRPRRQVAPKEK